MEFVFSGKKLKARRVKLGMSVNDVLGGLWKLGHKQASASLLYNYESDENVPGTDYALALASVLKCSVHDFTDKVKRGG